MSKVFLVVIEKISDDKKVTEQRHYVFGDSVASVAKFAQHDLIDGFDSGDLISVQYVLTVSDDFREAASK